MVDADWLQAQLGRAHLPALGSSLSTTLGSTGLNDLLSLTFVSMVVFETGVLPVRLAYLSLLRAKTPNLAGLDVS